MATKKAKAGRGKVEIPIPVKAWGIIAHRAKTGGDCLYLRHTRSTRKAADLSAYEVGDWFGKYRVVRLIIADARHYKVVPIPTRRRAR